MSCFLAPSVRVNVTCAVVHLPSEQSYFLTNADDSKVWHYEYDCQERRKRDNWTP